MGKIENLEIELDKTVFSPGDLINGLFKFKVNRKIKLNLIKVTVYGRANVNWTDPTYEYKGTTSLTPFTNSETYLDETKICSTKTDKQDLVLVENDYAYPFSFQLPKNLPGSLNMLNAKIDYFIIGYIDIPFSFDESIEKCFKLKNELNLNNFSALIREPFEVNDSKNVFLSSGGPISASFSVEKRGFLIGEEIKFKIKINNSSDRNVSKLQVELLQEISLIGEKDLIKKTEKSFNSILKNRFDKEIKEKSEEEINDEIKIPNVIDTSSNGLMKIINISYKLVFSFGVRGSTDKYLTIPIVIGNIPFET